MMFHIKNLAFTEMVNRDIAIFRLFYKILYHIRPVVSWLYP